MSIRMISQLRRWNADVAWLGQPSTTSIRLLPLQSYLRFFFFSHKPPRCHHHTHSTAFENQQKCLIFALLYFLIFLFHTSTFSTFSRNVVK